jgi:hypothetical protein
MNKLRELLEKFIIEDDKGRHKVKYDLSKVMDKYEKKIRNLRLKDIICLSIFICLITIQPSFAVTKCYKDICVGDSVLVINGIYKGNYVRIWDIIKEETPDEEEEQIRDYYKYFVSLADGTTLELYRDELK